MLYYKVHYKLWYHPCQDFVLVQSGILNWDKHRDVCSMVFFYFYFLDKTDCLTQEFHRSKISEE